MFNIILKILIAEIERIQNHFTKMCEHVSYENRLQLLNLLTLSYKWYREKMIET